MPKQPSGSMQGQSDCSPHEFSGIIDSFTQYLLPSIRSYESHAKLIAK
jgi:hypothetical protein